MKTNFNEIFVSQKLKNIKKQKYNQLIKLVDANVKMKIPYPMKDKYIFNVPPNLFQTWHTKNLPPGMQMAVNNLRASGPRFNYQLFDDNDCREFIQNNFDEAVLNAYDGLIPGAYKADLWRYCVLYKLGGIYLDIKYLPVNGFKLVNLLEKEYFCLDADGNGIYNAIMSCKAGNNILRQAIYQIVEHVRAKYYGVSPLDPTGPGLLSRYFSRQQKNEIELTHEFHISCDYRFILFNKYYVFQSYPEYINEHNSCKKVDYYGNLWNNRNIYK
jgi:mannosyltransferase OCH1-like enzyme